MDRGYFFLALAFSACNFTQRLGTEIELVDAAVVSDSGNDDSASLRLDGGQDLGPRTPLTLAFSPKSSDLVTGNTIFVGDVDGDGAPDLVVGSSFVSGNGKGDFSSPQLLADPGFSEQVIELADVDQNHTLDLLVGNGGLSNNGEVFLSLGKGKAAFAPAMKVPFTGHVAVGDINGDGAPDLVGYNDGVAVAFNSLNFATLQRFSPQIRTGIIRSADLNRDERDDVVAIIVPSDGTDPMLLAVLLSQPSGLELKTPLNPGGQILQDFALADLDNDGDVDLVSADRVGTVTTFRGHGDGTFSMVDHFESGAETTAIVIADFDQDGFGDVAALHAQDVAIMRGRGDGKLLAPKPFSVSTQLRALVAGDFDGDGKIDLAGAGYGGIVVLSNRSH